MLFISIVIAIFGENLKKLIRRPLNIAGRGIFVFIYHD